ncbi:MAG: hypothetical protein JWO65_1159 [Sphingomonas bacterium]|nr:hypothetical protein [Sphingomonas bacterium]
MRLSLMVLLALGAASMVSARSTPVWTVTPESVRAQEDFLAGDALRGRGSATADEAIAAAYVASQFEGIGLRPAPGMSGYLQIAPVPPTKMTQRAGVPEGAMTTNVIGYLPGTDPKAGTLLFTAHLDHLGVRDGVTMHGANDDASGVTAVLEIARAMAASGPHRRAILFVCYGSEEIGEVGSLWFAQHSPVPITDIVANIEFEMIGAQDPTLPPDTLMMTGYDRSTLGATLRDHGALVAADTHPEQHFFQRSDNYQLALAGVVAHTVSGWATTPTYHRATDTIANLDIPFMVRAIQSLIGPVRWLADGDYRPTWTAEGQPHRAP